MQNFKEVLGLGLESQLALRATGAVSPLLTASLSELHDAFSFAARLQRSPAPPAYRHLNGQFGLAFNDPVWAMLESAADAEERVTFRTHAPVEASADERCLTATGYATPIQYADQDGSIRYEQRGASDVVCFLSAPVDREGFHSMVQTLHDENEAQYDLPPGAMVECIRVDEPGTWEAFGSVRPSCRCYFVRVTYVC